MKYYISDCHFFHENIIKGMDNRPFSSVQEMNEAMIEKWNARIKGHDEVYILGDFSFGSAEETQKILSRLKGKLYLVLGNHDSFAHKTSFNRERFREISPMMITSDNHRQIVMCHYPMLFYPGQFQITAAGKAKTYMLYGHVHNTFDEVLINKFIKEGSSLERPVKSGESRPTPFNMINVFCMFSDYTPLTLDEWIEVDTKRRESLPLI